MSAKLFNEPAFPRPSSEAAVLPSQDGMSVRDYFAAKAMQEFMRVYVPMQRAEPSAAAKMMTIAMASYEMADAMLEARQK